MADTYTLRGAVEQLQSNNSRKNWNLGKIFTSEEVEDYKLPKTSAPEGVPARRSLWRGTANPQLSAFGG